MKRSYICTSCGLQFESAAKAVRNARHACEDGRKGTGRPLGTDGNVLPSQHAKETQIDHIPGDVVFDAPEATPDTPEAAPEELDLAEEPVSTSLPSERDPETEEEPYAGPVIDDASAQKLAALTELFAAMTTGAQLDPKLEQFLMAEALGGLVGIEIGEGQPFVIPGWVYGAACGVGLVLYKTGVLAPAVRPKSTASKAVSPDRKDTTSERGGWGRTDWEEGA